MRATLAVLVLCAGLLRAQPRIPLSDGWTFARETKAMERPAPTAFTKVPTEFPCAFETHEGPTFDGVGWYRRTLRELVPGHQGLRLRVIFHGAATHAEVFCNGVSVGTHLGAWTPFAVDLTKSARCDGNDLLEVRLDELVGHNTQGFLPIVQPHFGGLWKEIELECAAGPRIDREKLFAFGAKDTVVYECPLVAGPSPRETRLAVVVRDGPHVVARSPAPAAPEGRVRVAAPRPWSPRLPILYDVEFVLSDAAGEELDRVVRRVGFRELSVAGRALRWNGEPLQVRGVLHWGYEPPGFAPNRHGMVWHRQFEELKAAGFNLVKACLWVPPRSFYEAADEVGMLVWQEYPTWHPKFTPEHRAALEREFDEFFEYDRGHPSVAFRSLTCETGHSADLTILRALYERAHARIPNTLVVDDSSWIEWNRVHDFWDDHPYGNNSWWPGKLAALDRHVRDKGEKPLLLGEAITGDTWVDLASWEGEHGPQHPWWEPINLEAQRKAEAWLVARFGADAPREVLARSLAYVFQNRKYQIERFRTSLPDSGYVVSVIRDFRLARMGLYDLHDRLKWPVAAWQWHRDLMLTLDTAADRRAFESGALPLVVRVSNQGGTPVEDELLATLTRADGTKLSTATKVAVAPGVLSEPLPWNPSVEVTAPERVRLDVALGAQTNSWDLWVLPKAAPPSDDGVTVTERLDAQTVAALRGGARVLLRAGPTKGSLRTRAHQFYRGAPFVPEHPFAQRVPREFLYDLQSMDLETSRTLDLEPLQDELEPLLLVWDSHDTPDVKLWPLLAETGVGQGRLVISTLATGNAAGAFLERALRSHLAAGPAPRRALSAETLARLEADLAAEVLDLATWELRFDPDDRGRQEQWQSGGSAAAAGAWSAVRAGAHWERQGHEHKDGIGWYRCSVPIPAGWADKKVTLVAEGVDDSYEVYVNGKLVGSHGDPARKVTVWLERTTTELGAALRPGVPNQIALRVVDHAGAGGIWKPIYLTTGSADRRGDLVH